MKVGILRFYNSARGFGFITADDGSADVFVHAKSFKAISLLPREGMRLQYELAETSDGRQRAGRLLPATHSDGP